VTHLSLPVVRPNDWQRHMVTAALLRQVSFFRDAGEYFERAAALALSTRERVVSNIAWAETAGELGEKALRGRALAVVAQAEHDAAGMGARDLELRAKFHRLRLSQMLLPSRKSAVHSQLKSIASRAGNDLELKLDIQVATTTVSRHVGKLGRLPVDSAMRLTSLRTDGARLHENSRLDWAKAKDRRTVRKAGNNMRRVVDLRLHLADVPGACASLNVLGLMRRRAADWSKGLPNEALIREGYECHMHSKRLAARFHLPWHEAQATISLLALRLRHFDLFPGMESVNALRFDLDRLQVANDLLDNLRIEFILAWLPLREQSQPDWQRAASVFEAVRARARGGERRAGELADAAWINALASQSKPTAIATRCAWIQESAYWRYRLGRLRRDPTWLLDHHLGGPDPPG